MKLLQNLAIFILICQLYLVESEFNPIMKGTRRIASRQANTRQRELGVGYKPDLDLDDDEKDDIQGHSKGQSKGSSSDEDDDTGESTEETTDEDNEDQEDIDKGDEKDDKDNNEEDPEETTAPQNSPTTIPSFAPISTSTSSPSRAPTVFITSFVPTPTTTNLATNPTTISRSLLPFKITLEGKQDQFIDISIHLVLSLQEVLALEFGERFTSFRAVQLEEISFDVVQRQVISRNFNFEGEAHFTDIDVPSTKEVQDAQRQILREFAFEIENILNDKGIDVQVSNVTLEGDGIEEEREDEADPDNDEDSDTNGGASPEENESPEDSIDSTAIWASVGSVVVVCIVVLYIRKRRRNSGEIDHEHVEPVAGADSGVDHMMDTGTSTEPPHQPYGELT